MIPCCIAKRASLFLCACMLCGLAVFYARIPSSGAQRSAAMPPALQSARSFRGQITYRAVPLTFAAQRSTSPVFITGTLTVAGAHWSLDERHDHQSLHASSEGCWIDQGSDRLTFDDPFEYAGLANAWAPAVAEVAARGAEPASNGRAWSIPGALAVYIQPETDDVSGIVDTWAGRSIAYTFSGWQTINGLRLPRTIMRMQGATSERSFAISDYVVQWAQQNSARLPASSQIGQTGIQAQAIRKTPGETAAAWRWFDGIFAFLFGAVLLAAWLRRDALTDRLCTQLAGDPRGWRGEGQTVFVTPEGIAYFGAHAYRVGPVFYNRLTTVQSSPLFLRFTAKDVTQAIVLPRRFGVPSVFTAAAKASRGKSAAFSLIESLVASALFAAVIVGVVFPSMLVLSQADRVAARRQAALRLAANAFVDEQAALAYGAIAEGSRSYRVDDMVVFVTVKPGAVNRSDEVDIQVNDLNQHVLAVIATLLGPPVAAPSGTGQK